MWHERSHRRLSILAVSGGAVATIRKCLIGLPMRHPQFGWNGRQLPPAGAGAGENFLVGVRRGGCIGGSSVTELFGCSFPIGLGSDWQLA